MRPPPTIAAAMVVVRWSLRCLLQVDSSAVRLGNESALLAQLLPLAVAANASPRTGAETATDTARRSSCIVQKHGQLKAQTTAHSRGAQQRGKNAK